MSKVIFEKEIYNDVFYPLLWDDSRYLILKGGAGSGKSIFAVQKIMYRMLTEKNHRFLFVRKVHNTIRISMYLVFKDYVQKYGLDHLFVFQDSYLRIQCPSTSSEIICVGLDDREKLKSVAEPTGIWYEEPTELDIFDFTQTSLRLRGKKENYKQEILTFNPIDDRHWIRSEFFPPQAEQLLLKRFDKSVKKIQDSKEFVEFKQKEVSVKWVRNKEVDGEKTAISHTISHSNFLTSRFLDSEYKASLLDLKRKDKTYYDVYCWGNWGSIGNLVFDPPWHILDKFPDEFDEVVYGLDFGYHHPSALVKIGFRDTNVYVKEIFYASKFTNPQLIEYIKSNNLIEDLNDTIYADCAEPARINEFLDAGFNIKPSEKGNNSVKDSIDHLKSLNIYSHIENSNLNRELRVFKWQEGPNGKPIEGKVVPLNDDLIAATRYGIYSRHKQSDLKIAFINRAS